MATLKINFLSRCLGRQVDFNAIIPFFTTLRGLSEGYDGIYTPGQRFKVLFLLHGFSGDCNDYLNFTSITRYAEDRKIVVVMPSGFNSGYTDFENGDRVHSFVAKELVEVCRYMLPISDKREDTYIAGLSMGAAGAAKLALAHPETFSEVFCMSGAPSPIVKTGNKINLEWFGKDEWVYHGSLQLDPENYKNTKEDAWHMAEKNVKDGVELPRFRFTIGDKDFLIETVDSFYRHLEELGYDVEHELIPGYGHEWDFWDLKIREAIYSWFTI